MCAFGKVGRSIKEKIEAEKSTRRGFDMSSRLVWRNILSPPSEVTAEKKQNINKNKIKLKGNGGGGVVRKKRKNEFSPRHAGNDENRLRQRRVSLGEIMNFQ